MTHSSWGVPMSESPVERTQRMLKGQWSESVRVEGMIGYYTWLALGRPEGWLVLKDGAWWRAEQLNDTEDTND